MARKILTNCEECPLHDAKCSTEISAIKKYGIVKTIPLECDLEEEE